MPRRRKRTLSGSSSHHADRAVGLANVVARYAGEVSRDADRGRCPSALKKLSVALEHSGMVRAHFTESDHPASARRRVAQVQRDLDDAERRFAAACVVR